VNPGRMKRTRVSSRDEAARDKRVPLRPAARPRKIALADKIGVALARLRKRRKLSIEALAERCGLSAKFIGGAESATITLRLWQLEWIARALGEDGCALVAQANRIRPSVIRRMRRRKAKAHGAR
jgi:ribosome-binding protein aMBF1 (putative translation factor)